METWIWRFLNQLQCFLWHSSQIAIYKGTEKGYPETWIIIFANYTVGFHIQRNVRLRNKTFVKLLLTEKGHLKYQDRTTSNGFQYDRESQEFFRSGRSWNFTSKWQERPKIATRPNFCKTHRHRNSVNNSVINNTLNQCPKQTGEQFWSSSENVNVVGVRILRVLHNQLQA
jgi:hypothetical protein